MNPFRQLADLLDMGSGPMGPNRMGSSLKSVAGFVGTILVACAALGPIAACDANPHPRPAGFQYRSRPFTPPVPAVETDRLGALMARYPSTAEANGFVDILFEDVERFFDLDRLHSALLTELEIFSGSLARWDELVAAYRIGAEHENAQIRQFITPRLAGILYILNYHRDADTLVALAERQWPSDPMVALARALGRVRRGEIDDAAAHTADLERVVEAGLNEEFSGIYIYGASWAATQLN